MQTVHEQMRHINKEMVWVGAIWFIWGIALMIGDWFGIHKPTTTDAAFWFGLGAVAVVMKFVSKCTEVILYAIQDTIDINRTDTTLSKKAQMLG